MSRPKPPADYDDNPPLDAEFFARARPAAPGEAARLRGVLEQIVDRHGAGEPLDGVIDDARALLSRRGAA